MKVRLPIDSHLDDILQKLGQEPNLVLVAEPGAGKTTRLPPALLTRFKNQILVLEPRRVAAIAAADRVADENGFRLGDEVGYQVRFEAKTTAKTRLIYMTEALLARKLLADPELRGVDVVVLDEFHERSLHVDLALGLLRELQELRELKIVVMSATLEAEKIASFLGRAPIVRVPGKLFPLSIEWLEKSLRPAVDSAFYERLVSTLSSATSQDSGDTLVFLPGTGEIARAADNLKSWAEKRDFELLPLHGSLELEAQKLALRAGPRRRVILTTNIAESSLTVEGVTTVVDSGLAKVMRYDLATGFSRLELGRISLSSATQRAGRAARLAPGRCYRLWTRHEENSLKKDEVPEILRSDLSESFLTLAAAGVTDTDSFSWFEKPTPAALKLAKRELHEIKAIDSDGRLTEHGRNISRLPLPPRWTHFLILCAEHGHLKEACRLAALSQERDILRYKDDGSVLDTFSGDQIESDLAVRLQLLNDFAKSERSSRQNIHFHSAKQALLAGDRFEQMLKNYVKQPNTARSLDSLMLEAFSSRLCRRRVSSGGASERALMVGGRGVRLAPSSTVKKSEFFLAFRAVDFAGQADTLVDQAVGFTRDEVFATLEIEEREDLHFDEDKGRLFQNKQKYFRDLPVEEPRLSPASGAQSEEKLAQFLAQNLDYVKKHNEDLASFLERWAAFTTRSPETQAELSAQEVFQQAALGEKRLDDILKKDLVYFFESALPAEILRRFKQSAPAHFIAPTGSKFKIHYPPERQPYVEVRLQELFGLKANPKLFEGQVALQFHLLAPNYRPQQVTSDIASFWQNTYAEVRRELRTRYPKHSWPEDPTTAAPVKKGQSTKK